MNEEENVEVTIDQLLTVIGKQTVELEMLRGAHQQAMNRIAELEQPAVMQPMQEAPKTVKGD